MAVECPTKLFYTDKKEYLSQTNDDPFLESLAEGGFQVGALAREYFPDGILIDTMNYDAALRKTAELLKRDKVTIFEAAVRHKNLFIRADILVKDGNHFNLIEVKAKSIDTTDLDQFTNRKGEISSGWLSVMADVAFQKHLLQQAYPDCITIPYLMLADKNALSPSDGLNQKFRVVKDDNGRKKVDVVPLSEIEKTQRILKQIPVDRFIDILHKQTFTDCRSFVEEINYFSERYESDVKITPKISKKCGDCEFTSTPDEESQGFKSGYKECWKNAFGWQDSDFNDPTIFEVWDYRSKDKLINDGILKIADLSINDIDPAPDGKPGLSRRERQWLQIEKVQSGDTNPFFDTNNMQAEMESWTFPLHFIDFETATTAIPFNKGRKPYEGIAFQFSHHIVNADGSIEHAGEYINVERGKFPNYDFIRELKNQLEQDNGTIFKFSDHENTYLNIIYRQLKDDSAKINDRDALCSFIREITKSTDRNEDQGEKWLGNRNMVDMCVLVKRYYYDPATKGSNSIKAVLPAILNSSSFLQSKYSKPIYGAPGGIRSLNYNNWQWLKLENSKVVNPYSILPNLFKDKPEGLSLLTDDNTLNNGGAALTTYARMQFTEMSDYERNELTKGLLRYCELDTMAMVMIYEAWKNWGN
jgi:hypothetical protein